MDIEIVMTIGTEAMKTIMVVALPLLGLGMAVGLTVAVLQSATQIQEMSLTFVPKLFALGFGIFFFHSFMLDRLLGFTRYIIGIIPEIVRM